jgi:hypothetical protein
MKTPANGPPITPHIVLVACTIFDVKLEATNDKPMVIAPKTITGTFEKQ